MLTLCAMLVVSLASSGYLLVVSQPAVSRYTDLVRDARLMHQAMLDQETGIRGFLATGSPGFLESTMKGRAVEVKSSERILQGSTVDPHLTAELVPLLLAQDEWDDWARQAQRMRVDQPDRRGTKLLTFLYRGKALFDVYRAADTRATSYVVAQRDRAIRRERTALVVALLANLAMMAVGAVHTVLRRRRLERSVQRPMSELLETLGALRSGHLAAEAPTTGVVELDAIGSALSEFAHELRQAEELAAGREARLALLARRLETVITVARETSGSLSVRYVSESVAAAAADLLGAETCMWLRDEEGVFRAVRCSADPHGVVPPSDREASALVSAVAADARSGGDGSSRAYPLILAGSVLGVLEAAVATADDDVEHVLDALLSTAASGLESARLHSSVREQAELDALTRLPNRRRLEDDLAVEWKRSRRYGRPLAFVMLDLDHFKSLNDTHGHPVGDMVLRAAAAAIAASLRDTDTPYRYGGEEFAVLLRETDLDEALVVAERLRAAVAAVTIPGHPVAVTTSVGLAQAAPDTRDEAALVAAADGALYLAKGGGRNRVEVARTPASPHLHAALV